MDENSGVLRDVPLEFLSDDNSFQFRKDVFLRDLVENIRLVGHQVPIKVRVLEDGKYQIIYGFRRVQALRELGQETVRAIVHQDLSEEGALKERFAENCEREDYSPYEWVMICQSLEAKGYSRGQIGEMIGRSPTSVSRYLLVLSHPEILGQLCNREISFREALKRIGMLRCKGATTERRESADETPAEEELASSFEGTWGNREPFEADEMKLEKRLQSREAEEEPPWDSLDEGGNISSFFDPRGTDPSLAPSALFPQRDRLNRLARAINRTISETSFSQLPRFCFRGLPNASEGKDGFETETPALDILGLEVDRLIPFLERLQKNIREAGLGE